MKKSKIFISLLLAAAFTTACTNDNELIQVERELQVSTGIKGSTRAIVTGTDLGAGQNIGVSIYNTNDGLVYNGNPTFENVQYTSSASTGGTTWSSSSQIILTPTVGKAIAYYPYKSSVNVEAIPIETASQTDYMYSDWVNGLSATNARSNFMMNHALCAVKINIVNDTYTGTGTISKVAVTSQGMATQGMLNAKTGTITGLVGQGSEIASTNPITLTKKEQSVFLMAVPANTINDFTVNVTLDGKTFNVPVTMTEPVSKGMIYTVSLRAKDKTSGFDLTSVTVKEWTTKAMGSYIIGE